MLVQGPSGGPERVPLARDAADGNVHHAAGYAFPEPGEYRVSVTPSTLPAPVEFTVRVAPPRGA